MVIAAMEADGPRGFARQGPVSVSGYLIGNKESGKVPLPPKAELQGWYQYYFATERGYAGYEKNWHNFSKLIWQIASPDRPSAELRDIAAVHPRSCATSFQNFKQLKEARPPSCAMGHGVSRRPVLDCTILDGL